MAFATATDKPLRAAKCLAYSPAALDGAGSASAGEIKCKTSDTATSAVQIFIRPPRNLPALSLIARRCVSSAEKNTRLEQKQPGRKRMVRLAKTSFDSGATGHCYCAGETGCGSVAQIRAAPPFGDQGKGALQGGSTSSPKAKPLPA